MASLSLVLVLQLATPSLSLNFGGIDVLHARALRTRLSGLVTASADDDALRSLSQQLQAANAKASEAANAEARLRNMVATAKEAADREITARLAAEDASEELQAEVDALRSLYASDVDALQQSVDELTAQVEKQGGGGEEEGPTDERMAELTAERNELRGRALVAEADLADAVAELDAVRVLAGQDAAAHESAMEDMSEQLDAAKAAAAEAALVGGDEGAQEVIRELRGQVSELLSALEQVQGGAVAELMTLRPRIAEMERERDGTGSETQMQDGLPFPLPE